MRNLLAVLSGLVEFGGYLCGEQGQISHLEPIYHYKRRCIGSIHSGAVWNVDVHLRFRREASWISDSRFITFRPLPFSHITWFLYWDRDSYIRLPTLWQGRTVEHNELLSLITRFPQMANIIFYVAALVKLSHKWYHSQRFDSSHWLVLDLMSAFTAVLLSDTYTQAVTHISHL